MRKNKRGEKNMMAEQVMQIGSSFIKKEQKTKTNSFIYSIKVLINFIIFRKRLKKLDYKNVIEQNDEILNGKPVIKGTRITPKVIYEHLVFYCESGKEDLEEFIKIIKKEYPTLKKKNDETIFKSLLYYVSNESIINVLKK